MMSPISQRLRRAPWPLARPPSSRRIPPENYPREVGWQFIQLGGYPKIGVGPQNGWFIIMENPYQSMDDLGGKPLFSETSHYFGGYVEPKWLFGISEETNQQLMVQKSGKLTS